MQQRTWSKNEGQRRTLTAGDNPETVSEHTQRRPVNPYHLCNIVKW